MTQVTVTFNKKKKKIKQMAIPWILFHLWVSYLIQPNKAISITQLTVKVFVFHLVVVILFIL